MTCYTNVQFEKTSRCRDSQLSQPTTYVINNKQQTNQTKFPPIFQPLFGLIGVYYNSVAGSIQTCLYMIHIYYTLLMTVDWRDARSSLMVMADD